MTRKHLAAAIEEYDAQIDDLQEGKRDTFQTYRIELLNAGWDKAKVSAEIAAFKTAMSKRRAMKRDPDAVQEKDDLVDEILAEIDARAPRAARAREIIEEFSNQTPAVPAPPSGDTGLSQQAPADGASDSVGGHLPEGASETPKGVTAGETATLPSVEGVSSQTQPEARMPRASSPAVKTGKGGKLPVPGPENNRFVKKQHGGTSGEIDTTIPANLRREPHRHDLYGKSKSTEATV